MKAETMRECIRAALFLIVSFVLFACAVECFGGQEAIPNFVSAKRFFWKDLYPEDSSHARWQTFYCEAEFAGREGLHVEHVLPASDLKPVMGCTGSREQCRAHSRKFNYAEADLHNLYPAIGFINRQRSNYRFARVNENTEYGDYGMSCNVKADKSARKFYPPMNKRGDIARAMLYMIDEYGVEYDYMYKAMLREWSCADPPSPDELRRQPIIKRVQGNENEYITKWHSSGCPTGGVEVYTEERIEQIIQGGHVAVMRDVIRNLWKENQSLRDAKTPLPENTKTQSSNEKSD